MNTLTRRFVLRLIIGLLTFLVGVLAAVALGGFHPLEGRHARLRSRRCAEYARAAPSIAVPVQLPEARPAEPHPVFPDFSPDGRLARTPLATHPQAAEPVLPSFEDWGEVKSPKPVARSHSSQ